jgi:hypothetical protein
MKGGKRSIKDRRGLGVININLGGIKAEFQPYDRSTCPCLPTYRLDRTSRRDRYRTRVIPNMLDWNIFCSQFDTHREREIERKNAGEIASIKTNMWTLKIFESVSHLVCVKSSSDDVPHQQ